MSGSNPTLTCHFEVDGTYYYKDARHKHLHSLQLKIWSKDFIKITLKLSPSARLFLFSTEDNSLHQPCIYGSIPFTIQFIPISINNQFIFFPNLPQQPLQAIKSNINFISRICTFRLVNYPNFCLIS